MSLRITVEDEEKEHVMRVLPPIQMGDSVYIGAEDKDGHNFHILTIMPNGMVRLEQGIPESTGWPLDKKGRLQLLVPPANRWVGED